MYPIIELPSRSEPYSSSVYNAVDILRDILRHSHTLLQKGQYDVHRVEYYLDSIIQDAVPIVLDLTETEEENGLPKDWTNSLMKMFTDLIHSLMEAHKTALGVETSYLKFEAPVTVERNGKRGRPKKSINLEFLEEAMNPRRRTSLQELADKLGIHRNTLRYYLKAHNVDYGFTSISDSDLDIITRTFRKQYPDSGIRYLIGFLRRHNVRIAKKRAMASIHRVDRVGTRIRFQRQKKTRRTTYSVPRPNALWHIDGHHKLILWGIVIHGVVDGYSRMVTGLRASTNNRSGTVLNMFFEAIEKYGIPSRVRGDRGGENKDVAVVMIMARGRHRASFMWGTSTHNTRIERLWGEVGSQFARSWRAFFLRLERLHHLDRRDKRHLWLLHYLFLDDINNDCDEFVATWNLHPISGVARNRSPEDMYWNGQQEHGTYSQEIQDVHPKLLERYGGRIRRAASESSDAMDVDQVEAAYASNFKHKAVEVPKHKAPFHGQVEEDLLQEAFEVALKELEEDDLVPANYGMLPEEWGPEGYPTVENIRVGRRGLKEYPISLTDEIWRPRAEQWVRALHTMNHLTFTSETNDL